MTDGGMPDMDALMRVARFVTPGSGRLGFLIAAAKSPFELVAVFHASRAVRNDRDTGDTFEGVGFYAPTRSTIAAFAMVRKSNGRQELSKLQFNGFEDSESERATAAALAAHLKLPLPTGRAYATRKPPTVAAGTVFSLRPAFPKRESFPADADILAGIGVVIPSRAESLAVAVFQTADGHLRAAMIAESPLNDDRLASAITTAIAPHLKVRSHA